MPECKKGESLLEASPAKAAETGASLANGADRHSCSGETLTANVNCNYSDKTASLECKTGLDGGSSTVVAATSGASCSSAGTSQNILGEDASHSNDRLGKNGSVLFGIAKVESLISAREDEVEETTMNMTKWDAKIAERMRKEFLFSFGRLSHYARSLRPPLNGIGKAHDEGETKLESFLGDDESLQAFLQQHCMPTKKCRTDPTSAETYGDSGISDDDYLANPGNFLAARGKTSGVSILKGISTDSSSTRERGNEVNPLGLTALELMNLINLSAEEPPKCPRSQSASAARPSGVDAPTNADCTDEFSLKGSSDSASSMQMEYVRALIAAARCRALEKGCGNHQHVSVEDGDLLSPPVTLPAGIAANMASLLKELGLGGRAADSDGSGAKSSSPSGEDGMTKESQGGSGGEGAGPQRTSIELEARRRALYEAENDEMADMDRNMKEFCLRMECLTNLSQPTLELLVKFAQQTNMPGDLTMSLQRDVNHYATLTHLLGGAAAVAASMLWCYAEIKECPEGRVVTREPEVIQECFNHFLFRLHLELHKLPDKRLKWMVAALGVPLVNLDDIQSAIHGVGVLLFFSVVPLPLLLKVCGDLSIPTSDEATMDPHLLSEALAEKISAYLCPMRDGSRLSIAKLPFLPRLQVHEHAPGSFTCTIDNAGNMGRVPQERLNSNRFSCNKIKWRAVVINDGGNLHFRLWHRHLEPLSVHMVARTSEPKKKKAKGATSQGPEKNAEDHRVSSALYLEKEATVSAGEMVGFDNFINVTVALNSPTTSQTGLRTYSRVEDRIVFQLSLNMCKPVGTLLESGKPAEAQTHFHGRDSSKDHTVTTEDHSRSTTIEATALLTEGKEESTDASAVNDVAKGLADIEKQEKDARAAVDGLWQMQFRNMQGDEHRAGQRALQKTRDRERKALLAKVAPSPELVKELDKLVQAVQLNRQHVSKLAKEKTKEERDLEKLKEKLETGKEELERLQGVLESNTKLLASLQDEMKATQIRTADKKRRIQMKQTKKQQNTWSDLKRVLEPNAVHHDTLVIDDFGSFLTSPPAMPNIINFSTSPGFLASTPWGPMSAAGLSGAPKANDMESAALSNSFGRSNALSQESTVPPGATGPTSSASASVDQPMAGIIGVNGGLSHLDTYTFSTRQNHTMDVAPSTTPVFSTHAISMRSVLPSVSLQDGNEALQHAKAAVRNSPPTQVSSGSAMSGLPLQSGLSFGTLGPSPFSTKPVNHTNIYSHLDVNAQPYTPHSQSNSPQTPSPGNQPHGSGGSLPQPTFAFTVTAGGGGNMDSFLTTSGCSAATKSPLFQTSASNGVSSVMASAEPIYTHDGPVMQPVGHGMQGAPFSPHEYHGSVVGAAGDVLPAIPRGWEQ